MFDQMKKMMEMKRQADKMKKELEKIQQEYNDVRGLTIKINGAQMFQGIEIDDSWLSPEKKSRFQTELVRALNMAIKKSQKEAAIKMQKSGNLNIPGLT